MIKKAAKWMFVFLIALYGTYQGFLFFAHNGNPDYYDIDHCLDLGGCWNYEKQICHHDEPNAQELCDQANPYKK